MKKLFLWILSLLVGLLLIAALFLGVLAVFQIPIDLSDRKELVEGVAEELLDRPVSIHGTILFRTSLEPSLTLSEIHIRNREGFPETDYLFVRRARLRIGLVPLLRKKITVRELAVQGVKAVLLENNRGMNNWSGGEKKDRKTPPAKRKRLMENAGLASDTLVIDRLDFADIEVSFAGPETEETLVVSIRELNGSVQPGKPTFFHLDGSWQAHPFTSAIQIGSLQELLEQDRSWLEITAEIAETKFYLAGTVDLVTVLDSLNLKAEIQGSRLDSLNELLEVDLPSLQTYAASADLTLRRKLLTLNKLQVQVGDSSFEGNMIIDGRKERADVAITLTAPLIRIDDFVFRSDADETVPDEVQDRNFAGEKEREQEVPAGTGGPEGKSSLAELFDQNFFRQFDANLAVDLKKVVSGNDSLGGGELKASLRESRLSVDPLRLDLPGGSLLLTLSFEPGKTNAGASLRVLAENYDFGIAARRAKPGTDMGGTLNLDIDIRSTGGSLDEILANGNGYIDFSARPVNLNSGIMDLWVVNLLAAILFRSNKEGSPVNCMISRWSLQAGVLTPDAFVVDTGSMRICGSGSISLRENSIDLHIAPAPKKAQFFSLATPFRIVGNIQDINMGIEPGGVIGTSVRFITSPVTVPLGWFLARKIPADGSDICSMSLGADNRPEKKPPGCR